MFLVSDKNKILSEMKNAELKFKSIGFPAILDLRALEKKVAANRPRMVVIEGGLGLAATLNMLKIIEETKWAHDIELDKCIIEERNSNQPGVHSVKDMAALKELLKTFS